MILLLLRGQLDRVQYCISTYYHRVYNACTTLHVLRATCQVKCHVATYIMLFWFTFEIQA